jgi:hypothetical protein
LNLLPYLSYNHEMHQLSYDRRTSVIQPPYIPFCSHHT